MLALDMQTIFGFSLASFILAVVPGPNVTAIIGNSISRGTSAGLAVVFGTQIGVLCMVLVVAFGLDALISFMGFAFDWIKLAGAAYLVWLGISFLRSSGDIGTDGLSAELAVWKLVLQGFLVLWSNPKALIFFGSFIPQFIDPAKPAFEQILSLGIIFMVIATLTDGAYAVLAGRARRALTRRRVQIVSRVSGVFLMAGGVWLVLQRQT